MRRYCIVGVGLRGVNMFLKPLIREYGDVAEVVGLCDLNRRRLELANEIVERKIPCFTNFDEMLRTVDCDTVIVTSVDATHDQFIVKALEYGKNVITEKPMAIDDAKCRAILEAERRSRGRVAVTFNYRFTPYVTRIKELLLEGVVGKVHSIDFSWFLDTMHGADYYRRWHRRKENSGGLFVHKATHHFDLINWWLEQDPVRVYASGGRNFYGPKREQRSERCLGCQYADACKFYYDISQNEALRKFYLEAEAEDGYYRDRCVFDAGIDIEDTMAALVNYSGGTQLSYTLHSFMPFEGWRIAFNGSKGRLEAGVSESFYTEYQPGFSERGRVRRSVDPIEAAHGNLDRATADEIRIYPIYGSVESEWVPRATGGHGGGDVRLREMLFRENVPDPLGHTAGSRAGAMSILIGAAANQSMATGMPVAIGDLLPGELSDSASTG